VVMEATGGPASRPALLESGQSPLSVRYGCHNPVLSGLSVREV
jgi:hypothetical protein